MRAAAAAPLAGKAAAPTVAVAVPAGGKEAPSPAVATTAGYAGHDVFYPRGGKSECVWEVTYHSPINVTDTTQQIGLGKATW